MFKHVHVPAHLFLTLNFADIPPEVAQLSNVPEPSPEESSDPGPASQSSECKLWISILNQNGEFNSRN